MAWPKVKTEHAGDRTAGSRWCSRGLLKQAAKRRRRRADRRAVAF